ncbi:MAG: bifunctional acetate--CoA ligase family protein/GNAT family N-acetyltransferase [Acidobacteriota bacterium]
MTVRNLDFLFRPKSVALIGASKRAGSVGAVVARNLFGSGFDGPVMPVNPRHRAVEGVLTYPDVASLPVTPDLAVIATPPETVPGLVAELGERGTRGVVVITAGFSEGGSDRGAKLQREMLAAARPHLLRVIGPNCVGIQVPGIHLNASFVHIQPLPGRLAFVTQSGAIVTAVVDWATARGIGFSHLVSLGDMADVDFGDMLDYLASDTQTRAILLYMEAVKDARKFMSAARAAARTKHVVVVNAGRHEEGARAAASTGSLAGSDAVYDTAFRRAGMLRVHSLQELFGSVESLAKLEPPKGDRLAILTNGGGIGVMATDDLIAHGGRLAELSDDTIERLDKTLPSTWSRANPVDIIGDAPGSRYADALEALLTDPGANGVLVINCPTAVASSTDAAQAVIDTAAKHRGNTLLTCWLGEKAPVEARQLFERNRIPTYETPESAVRSFMYMVDYRRNQEMLMETPPSVPEDFSPDLERAKGVIDQALAENRTWLTEVEAKQVLAAYAIPVARTRTADSPEAAARLAAEEGGSVVLKILSPDITHKSDIGGVALDLIDPKTVEDTARGMMRRIQEKEPDAHISGFTVQPFVRRPRATELIIGTLEDAQFGPVILFGQGGTAVEVIRDKALALPPLNMHLAYDLMSRTRIYRLLEGYRDRSAVDLDAIALTLIKVSQLVMDLGSIEELDINPLLADSYGVVALDARIKVKPSDEPAAQRLAIRPYPKELEQIFTLGDGREIAIRPVRPEDEPALHAMFHKLTPEEIRLRFFVPMKTLSHMAAARFTQLDYDREMALVLAEPGRAGIAEIFGVARIAADPDNESAEYAIIVRGDMTGAGLGIFLMRRLIDYARKRGIGEMWGDVLRENRTMLRLCEMLGFTRENVPDEPDIVRVRLDLRAESAGAAS